MKKIEITAECIGCGACEVNCPEVFLMEGDKAIVKKGADLSLDAKIKEAVSSCPVEAIKTE